MSQARTPPLESRRRPKLRARYVGAVRAQGAEALACAGHSQHLLGVLLPIGGQPQDAVRPQFVREQRDEAVIDQAALVVALLVPGIREENQDRVERLVGDGILQHLDRVVAQDSQVSEPLGLSAQEEPSDPGPMYLDAEIIGLRMGFGERTDHLPGAESDFQTARRAAAEKCVEIERGAVVIAAEGGPCFTPRALLRGRDPAGAQYEASNGTPCLHGHGLCLYHASMRKTWLIGVLSVLAGCAGLPQHVKKIPSEALQSPQNTELGRIVQRSERGNARTLSGVRLLASGEQALDSLIALADHAERTIDLQYYIIRHDDSAQDLLNHVRSAADRGVRVRVLVDDLNTAGEDRHFLHLSQHPDIEVRVLNPFPGGRSATRSRTLPSISDIPRINHRMHNKLFVADNERAITGGRNIGDEYFTLDKRSNFIDLDVVAAGPIVPQLSASFDAFWNSKYAYPIASLAGAAAGPAPAPAAAPTPGPPAAPAPAPEPPPPPGAQGPGAPAGQAPATPPRSSEADWLERELDEH